MAKTNVVTFGEVTTDKQMHMENFTNLLMFFIFPNDKVRMRSRRRVANTDPPY